MNVTVIDLGIGNLLSIIRGLEHFGAKVTVTSDSKIIFVDTDSQAPPAPNNFGFLKLSIPQ